MQRPATPPLAFRRRRGSTLGWVLGIVAALVAIVILLVPATRRGVPEAAMRAACQNNLKRIATALLTHVEERGALPPAFTVDAEGRPLQSWRTVVLPSLEEGDSVPTIDPTRPWDDPANAPAAARTPVVFRCPSTRSAGTTTYQLVVAPDGLVRPDGSATREELAAADPTTILVVDVPPDLAVPWTSPLDEGARALETMAAAQGQHRGLVAALQADGTVVMIDLGSLTPEGRRALVTPAFDSPPGRDH